MLSGQHSANSVKYSPDIGQEGDCVWIIFGLTDVREMIEDSVDLPVVVTVLAEDVLQEHQLCMQALLIA
jgi:hypothetical protein